MFKKMILKPLNMFVKFMLSLDNNTPKKVFCLYIWELFLNQMMLINIIFCFVIALTLLFLGASIKKKNTLWISILPISGFVFFLSQIPVVLQKGNVVEHYQWIPSLGVSLDFRLDGLSLLFSLLITGIGSLVFAYTSHYMKGNPQLDRFFGYLSVFMAAMLGLVLSDNIISLFVFWELTSISSFFLIGFNHDSKSSRKSALRALAITGFGGLFLLILGLTFGMLGGTYSIQALLNSGIDFTQSELYILLLVFIFGAAFTKSAQFPFHFWLPGAMEAPTPVSTYLHSATMVKAGIYLLFRFSPLLAGHDYWHLTLIFVGGFTMIYAAFHTFFRTDMKGVLAYSTISALGIMVFLIGLGTQTALLAALVFVVVHALYKATLFLITGVVDHETHTRDLTQLSGLSKVILPVAVAGFLAAFSNAGIPLFAGFIGKDLVYEATLHHSFAAYGLTFLAFITHAFLAYAGYVVGIKPFIGKLPEMFKKVHLPSPLLYVPPLILAVLGLLVGLFPQYILGDFMTQSLTQVFVKPEEVYLKIWHGWNEVLVWSLITISLGLLLFYFIKPSKRKVDLIAKLDLAAPIQIFENLAIGFEKISKIWTNFFQNGYLRNYVLTIISVLTFFIGYSLFFNAKLHWDFNQITEVTFYEASILSIMVVAIFMTVFSSSRLTAVASMGVIGYAICLLFVFYSAPDLAMTQFTIDTLTVILFVLVLYRLPKYLKLSENTFRVRDGIISLILGGLITILAMEVLHEPQKTDTGDFYAQNAYLLAKGKNVVNVILVDFRGMDTLIEITVLVIAALGVFGLLKLRVRNK
jgi:multicomponent Na+:H+ antiporter subunit A